MTMRSVFRGKGLTLTDLNFGRSVVIFLSGRLGLKTLNFVKLDSCANELNNICSKKLFAKQFSGRYSHSSEIFCIICLSSNCSIFFLLLESFDWSIF